MTCKIQDGLKKPTQIQHQRQGVYHNTFLADTVQTLA